jgi:hypothetical protein
MLTGTFLDIYVRLKERERERERKREREMTKFIFYD